MARGTINVPAKSMDAFVTVPITISAGRMRGDIDGDGKITAKDKALIERHLNGEEPILDALKLECADFDGDGEVTLADNMYISRLVAGWDGYYAGAGGDLMGRWDVNPNYENEEMQFFIDLAFDDIWFDSSAIVSVQGSFGEGFFRGECHGRALRLFAKLCPIEPVEAIVQYGKGDGTVVVVYGGTDNSETAPLETQTITIPAGRMRGDVDGDGKITTTDYDLVLAHNQGISEITDATQQKCADVDADGSIELKDLIMIEQIRLGNLGAGAGGDILNNWAVNPDYETDEMQFYTDIPVYGLLANYNAIVSVQGTYESGNFRAECRNDALRLYAKLCPISEVKAIIQYRVGDGVAVVVCEGSETETPTVPGMQSIIIAAGRMRGDVDGDGKITAADVSLIYNHVLQTELITDETALLCADINGDGSINPSDTTAANFVANGEKAGRFCSDILGNWTVNPGYANDEMQFYTDISVVGMAAGNDAVVSVQGVHPAGSFRGECMDGALRLYAKLCPIAELNAVVQFKSGEGTVVVVSEGAEHDSSGDDESAGMKVFTGVLGTNWTENEETGVKTQDVAIEGILEAHNGNIDHDDSSIDGTSEGYALYVEEENQWLSCITNGRMPRTYDGYIRFEIFGDPNTVEIPFWVGVS